MRLAVTTPSAPFASLSYESDPYWVLLTLAWACGFLWVAFKLVRRVFRRFVKPS